MNASGTNAAKLMRMEELLRQQRETFDQQKSQESKWFNLRLQMGYTAALMLPLIALVCTYILFESDSFPATVVTSAGATLFVDILGLITAVWKVVLNPNSNTQLKPVVPNDILSLEEK